MTLSKALFCLSALAFVTAATPARADDALQPSLKADLELGSAMAILKVPATIAPELFFDGGIRIGKLSLVGELSFIPPLDAEVDVHLNQPRQAEGTRVSLGFIPCLRYSWVFGCAMMGGSWLFWLLYPPKGLPVQEYYYQHFSAMLGGRVGLEIPLQDHFGLRLSGDLLSFIPTLETGETQYFGEYNMSHVSGAIAAAIVATF